MSFQPSNRLTFFSNCRKLYSVNCFNPIEFILKMNFAKCKIGKKIPGPVLYFKFPLGTGGFFWFASIQEHNVFHALAGPEFY